MWGFRTPALYQGRCVLAFVPVERCFPGLGDQFMTNSRQYVSISEIQYKTILQELTVRSRKLQIHCAKILTAGNNFWIIWHLTIFLRLQKLTSIRDKSMFLTSIMLWVVVLYGHITNYTMKATGSPNFLRRAAENKIIVMTFHYILYFGVTNHKINLQESLTAALDVRYVYKN